MRHVSLRAVATTLLVSSALTASAQEITFNFTGTISELHAPLGPPFEVGQAVSGSYTFDSTAIDQDGSPVIGRYENVSHFELSVPAAGYVATATGGRIRVVNDEAFDPPRMRDLYSITMDQGLSGSIGNFTLDGLGILLRDNTASAFSSDALPLVPPSLTDFADGTEADVRLIVLPFSGGTLYVELISLTTSTMTVPEQIDEMIDTIAALASSGAIRGGLATSLTQKLARAKEQATTQPQAAIGMLFAFNGQVAALVSAGILDFAAGQALIAAAQSVIADLSAG